MLLEWFWRSQSERKGDFKVGFSFPGGSLRVGRCYVKLVLVFPVGWPRGVLGSTARPACPGTMWGGGRLGAVGRVRGDPASGFWWIPWCWSSLNEASLFSLPRPHHLFVLMQGKGPDPRGKGRQLLRIS